MSHLYQYIIPILCCMGSLSLRDTSIHATCRYTTYNNNIPQYGDTTWHNFSVWSCRIKHPQQTSNLKEFYKEINFTCSPLLTTRKAFMPVVKRRPDHTLPQCMAHTTLLPFSITSKYQLLAPYPYTDSFPACDCAIFLWEHYVVSQHISSPCRALDTVPTVNLILKHDGLCHSGHNDYMTTLVLSSSDQFPAGHSDLSTQMLPIPEG